MINALNDPAIRLIAAMGLLILPWAIVSIGMIMIRNR